MKWTTQHDIEFCKEVVASKLFETKKKVSRKSSGMGRYCQQVGENGTSEIQGRATFCQRQIQKTNQAVSKKGK